MSQRPQTPIFLERVRYRQRRLRDAAQLVSVLGIILWMLPLLWSGKSLQSGPQTLVYVFVVWVLLIILAGVLSGFVRNDEDNSTDENDA